MKFLHASGKKGRRYGLPVRSEFFSITRAAGKAFRLLVTGGSQGVAYQRVFVDAMDRLAARKNELAIVHQTGERDYNAVRTAYARREINAEVVPFLTNMAERFAWLIQLFAGRSHYRSGNRRAAEPPSSSFRKGDGQPPIAQRAGNDRRAPAA